MRHVWCLQDWELFARGAEAWLNEGRVLEEFEILWGFVLFYMFFVPLRSQRGMLLSSH
jgi:hypothetical protein